MFSALATIVLAACVTTRPLLIAPANHAAEVHAPVTFQWNAVEGATGYRVSIVEESFDIDVVAETSLTSATARLGPGDYGWYVDAFFDGCPSTRSEVHVFEMMRAENCAGVAPQLLLPTQGARVASPVTFSWTPVPGAIAYEVSAALGDGEPVFVGETAGTSLLAHLGEGEVTWSVDAEFDGCDDTVSGRASFEIPVDPNCRKDAPLPIAPTFGAANVPTRVDFIWTAVDRAKSYSVLLITDGNDDVRTLGTTTETRLSANVPAGPVLWAVRADFEDCPPKVSPMTVFDAAPPAGCSTPHAPVLSLDPRAAAGETYLLLWSASANTGLHEVQEATREDFTDAATRPVNDILLRLSHEVAGSARYFYRVRSLSSCGAGAGAWSNTASIVVSSAGDAASYGTQKIVAQSVRVPGSAQPRAFTARAGKPWLTVSPASGVIPIEGLDLTVTARPQDLPIGTNNGTILVDIAAESKRISTNESATLVLPIAVNLVTPVSPVAGNAPLPTSLIIPAVGHGQGLNGRFQSDVRVVNTSAQIMRYLLNFTPSRTDGTRNGQQTTIQIAPGETAALDDVLSNFFGFAAAGDDVSGVLEIRPLTATSKSTPKVTFAASRTYAVTAAGTLGQFVPAIPFSRFAGRDKVLSLQQIAQSAAYRTNLGLVEASGEPATVLLTVFGDDGQSLGAFPIDLLPGEHMQLNAFLQAKGLSVTNGRIEAGVTSPTGKVTAYASVIDNASSDPMLILPVDRTAGRSSRMILPGIAGIDAPGARWRSDIRVFNAGALPSNMTLTFVPQGSPAGTAKSARVEAGQILRLDHVVQTFFNEEGSGSIGSVIVDAPDGGAIIATARTYLTGEHGTYGQFIPGLTIDDGIGAGDRALQLLHIEESERFRTNVGIVELSGRPAEVEITAITPDSKESVSTQLSLQPNESRQLNSILSQFGLPATYNARITLKVVGGSGIISGYASVIDNVTGDPTYVPAQ
jgi:hypothetical protein